jgi:cellulose synthase/poly-beta-1,6-N-acetylglucosamine synthase-like glycosyltransferase
MTIDANWAADASMLLWGLQNAVSTFAVLAYRHGLPRPEIPGTEPRVAVILPVKGDQGLGRFLGLLRGQRYARYRIIASIESDQDPALGVLAAAQHQMGASIEIVIAGLASSCGQKVWNQLAGLERLTADDEIVAFIDADTLPTPLWLPRLVAAIVDAGRPVVTGYRWMTPSDDRWSSSCLAAANASIATLPRGGLKSHLC